MSSRISSAAAQNQYVHRLDRHQIADKKYDPLFVRQVQDSTLASLVTWMEHLPIDAVIDCAYLLWLDAHSHQCPSEIAAHRDYSVRRTNGLDRFSTAGRKPIEQKDIRAKNL